MIKYFHDSGSKAVEKETNELSDEIFKKKSKFWKIINFISTITCLLLCLVSVAFNFLYNKINSYVVFALGIIFFVVVLIAVFGMFFSWLKLRRLEMKFYDNEQKNEESEPDNEQTP